MVNWFVLKLVPKTKLKFDKFQFYEPVLCINEMVYGLFWWNGQRTGKLVSGNRLRLHAKIKISFQISFWGNDVIYRF